MPAGRPTDVDPGSLYALAHQFYWDFRRLDQGMFRRRFDKKQYDELEKGMDHVQLVTPEDRERHQRMVDLQIERGELEPERRGARLEEIAQAEESGRRSFYLREASELSTKQVKVRPETEAIDCLLNPKTTPDQIREICKEAVMIRIMNLGSETREVEVPAWPIPPGSTFPTYLSQYAEQYVAALNDPRFPTCDVAVRPTTKLKQFWFLSRALAGAVFGIANRTAINLIGSLRPEQVFTRSRQAKPTRRGRARGVKLRKK